MHTDAIVIDQFYSLLPNILASSNRSNNNEQSETDMMANDDTVNESFSTDSLAIDESFISNIYPSTTSVQLTSDSYSRLSSPIYEAGQI